MARTLVPFCRRTDWGRQCEVCPLAWFLQDDGMSCLPPDTSGSSSQSRVVLTCVCVHASLHHQVVNQLRAGDLCPSHLSNPWDTSCGLWKYPLLIWWDDQGKGMSELYKTAVDITVDVACAWVVCIPDECSSLDSFLIQSTVSRPAIMQRWVP